MQVIALNCLKSMEIKKDENGNVIPFTAEELQAEVERLEVEKTKVEEERENYKKGLLEREEKIKTLKKGSSEEDEEENGSKWDEASTKFQEETILKSTKQAEEAAAKVIETKNEKQAIAEFLEQNKLSDEEWQKILTNYTPTNGKDTIGSIKKDLERAFVLHKFDSGEIIDPEKIKQTEAQRTIKELGSNANGNYGKYEEQKENVSDGQLSIATRMRVSEEALKNEDDTLSAEIKIS